jgi:hypothetical protein
MVSPCEWIDKSASPPWRGRSESYLTPKQGQPYRGTRKSFFILHTSWAGYRAAPEIKKSAGDEKLPGKKMRIGFADEIGVCPG